MGKTELKKIVERFIKDKPTDEPINFAYYRRFVETSRITSTLYHVDIHEGTEPYSKVLITFQFDSNAPKRLTIKQTADPSITKYLVAIFRERYPNIIVIDIPAERNK